MELDRAIADVRNGKKGLTAGAKDNSVLSTAINRVVTGEPQGSPEGAPDSRFAYTGFDARSTNQFDSSPFFAPQAGITDPNDNSVIGNAVRAPLRALTGLITPGANTPAAPTTPALSVAAPAVQVPYVDPNPGGLRPDVKNLLAGDQRGSIGGGFTAAAVKDPNAAPTAPEYPALKPLPRLNFDVGGGQNVGGGVFGALARNVNAAAEFGDANNARKTAHQGFSDQVASFDSNTKRLAVTTQADIAKAKNTIDLLKSGKEVQEAQLIGTHRALLAEYAKNPSPELADMIALVKGHVLPDHIINFPESVINQSPPSAISSRHGTAITPNKGGGGFTVAAVNGNQPSPNDKVFINKQGQRVRMVGDKEVAF